VVECTKDNGGHKHVRRSRRWIRAAVLVLALGILACVIYWLRQSAKNNWWSVNISDGTAWTNRTSGQLWQLASEMTITLRNPVGGAIADAEVFVENWSDDCGRDLLVRTVRPGRDTIYHNWQIVVGGSGKCLGGSSAPLIVPSVSSSEPDTIIWTLGSPVEVSPAARFMRAKGWVSFRQGRGRQVVRVEKKDLTREASFRLGGASYTVESTPRELDDHPELSLRSTDTPTPLLAVRFVDHKGGEIPRVHATGTALTNHSYRKSHRVYESLVRYDRLECPPSAQYATLIAECWSESWVRRIPFDVQIPVASKASQYPVIPAGAQVLGSPSEGDLLESVPDDAWGPLASDEPTGLFEVVRADDTPVYAPEGLGIPRLALRLKKPLTVVSYDITITACRDDSGNTLLETPPVRSSIEMYWRLDAWDAPIWPAERPNWQKPAECCTFSMGRSPSRKATTVSLEGTVKLKVADSLKTVELKDVLLAKTSPFSIGPVQITYAEDDKELQHWHVRGDRGLIRELTVLNKQGGLLAHVKRDGAHCYCSNRCLLLMQEEEKFKKNTKATIRAEYYADCRHYVLPFRIIVPLER